MRILGAFPVLRNSCVRSPVCFSVRTNSSRMAERYSVKFDIKHLTLHGRFMFYTITLRNFVVPTLSVW